MHTVIMLHSAVSCRKTKTKHHPSNYSQKQQHLRPLVSDWGQHTHQTHTHAQLTVEVIIFLSFSSFIISSLSPLFHRFVPSARATNSLPQLERGLMNMSSQYDYIINSSLAEKRRGEVAYWLLHIQEETGGGFGLKKGKVRVLLMSTEKLQNGAYMSTKSLMWAGFFLEMTVVKPSSC